MRTAGSASTTFCVAAASAFVVALALALALPVHALAGAPASRLLFGAYAPVDPDNGRTDTIAALEGATARPVDIAHWYQPWGSRDWIVSVQREVLDAVIGTGRTPLITWEPWDPRNKTPYQPAFSLARIAGGTYDGYIAQWADKLRDVGRPVYLRPMHEMNGSWYPWANGINANSPERYIAAWRHIVDIFRGHGASNVRFVWSPNHLDMSGNHMESFYPDAGYVDVLAMDGYNWGATMPQNGGWQTFREVFQNAYDRLAKLGPQPIWITEVGSAPEGGDKAAWVRDMFAKAARMSRLRAIVWFNENKERDWRADATPRVAAAFRPRARLRLRAPRTVRVGQTATVRWTVTGAIKVSSWKLSHNGRVVRTVAAGALRRLRVRVRRSGRTHWRLTGYDARSNKLVSARSRRPTAAVSRATAPNR